VKYVLPIGALFSVVLWLGNACYLYLSVSFIQMLKAAMPVAVFLTGVLMGTSKYTHKTAVTMVVVAAGVTLASYGEIDFVTIGVVLQVVAIICECFRITLVQVCASAACCCVYHQGADRRLEVLPQDCCNHGCGGCWCHTHWPPMERSTFSLSE
jgi:hypothetical protein